MTLAKVTAKNDPPESTRICALTFRGFCIRGVSGLRSVGPFRSDTSTLFFFDPQKPILTKVFWKGFRESDLEVRSVGTLEALIYMWSYVPLHTNIFFITVVRTNNVVIRYDLSLRTT